MIKLIMGPMFSGKTTEMLRLLERSYIAGKKVILLRPLTDTRSFLSHSKKDTTWLEEKQVNIHEADITDYDVIGIDEGQFHNDLRGFCLYAVACGKIVIVSALHATSESEMFSEIVKLIPHCDSVVKLNAVCKICGSDNGAYTFFKEGAKTEQEKVGGADKYEARCRECYLRG